MSRKRKIFIASAVLLAIAALVLYVHIQHDHTLLLLFIFFFYVALMVALDKLPKKHTPTYKVALLCTGILGACPGQTDEHALSFDNRILQRHHQIIPHAPVAVEREALV